MNNNNNTNKYINYDEAINSRMCWYIGCKCKSKLSKIGNERKNGDKKKIDYNSRRMHVGCTKKFNEALYYDMYFEDIDNPEYNNIYKKNELLRIKPEFRPFLNEFKSKRAYAIRMSKQNK